MSRNSRTSSTPRLLAASSLKDVETVAGRDFDAVIAHAARRDGRTVDAVERFGEDARRRGLPRPARPDEKIGVRQPILLDRVLQGTRDVFLADEIVKCLRPVLARENLVTHAPNLVPRGLGENRFSGWKTRPR